MTNEAIRIAIAESLGWVYEPKDYRESTQGNYPDWNHRSDLRSEPPNYHESLDACREFEDIFNSNYEQSVLYAMHLKNVVYRTKHSGVNIDFAVATATPLQRCEAYLRTLNKRTDK
jgi:hypothetical protein